MLVVAAALIIRSFGRTKLQILVYDRVTDVAGDSPQSVAIFLGILEAGEKKTVFAWKGEERMENVRGKKGMFRLLPKYLDFAIVIHRVHEKRIPVVSLIPPSLRLLIG